MVDVEPLQLQAGESIRFFTVKPHRDCGEGLSADGTLHLSIGPESLRNQDRQTWDQQAGPTVRRNWQVVDYDKGRGEIDVRAPVPADLPPGTYLIRLEEVASVQSRTFTVTP